MTAQIGDRCGAIQSANKEEVRLFGFGTFEGHKVPPLEAGGMAAGLHHAGYKNPCIKLDSGDEVFGCECWWGPEEKIKETIGERRIVNVSIVEARKEQLA